MISLEQKRCSVRTELEETKKEVQRIKRNLLYWKMVVVFFFVLMSLSMVRIRSALRQTLITVRQCVEIFESIYLDDQVVHQCLR